MRSRGEVKKSFTRSLRPLLLQNTAMSENPHVRAIHIFSPKDELRIDDGDPRRRPKTKRSSNPVAGLLDEADAADGRKPAASAGPGERTGMPAGQSQESAPSGGPSSRSTAASTAHASDPIVSEAAGSRSDEPLLGDMPEIIEGDFPDPVDL